MQTQSFWKGLLAFRSQLENCAPLATAYGSSTKEAKNVRCTMIRVLSRRHWSSRLLRCIWMSLLVRARLRYPSLPNGASPPSIGLLPLASTYVMVAGKRVSWYCCVSWTFSELAPSYGRFERFRPFSWHSHRTTRKYSSLVRIY